MGLISTLIVEDKTYFLPPTENQAYKELASLKTPKTGDWYIYYNIWDFELGKFKPQKYWSNLNSKETLALKATARLLLAKIELEEANEDLKKGINPKTARPIAPFDNRTYVQALEDATDDSPIPRLSEALAKFLAIKSGTEGKLIGAENKENTAITYKYFLGQFMTYCKAKNIDNLRMDKFEKYQLFNFMEEKYISGQWAPLTHNTNLGYLKAMFNYFSKVYDYNNVAKNLDDKEVLDDSTRFEAFSDAEFKEVLAFFDNEYQIVYPHYVRTMPPDRVLALVSRTIFYTFLRPSELRRIKIKHVKRYKENFFDLSVDITKNRKKAFNELYIEPCLVQHFEMLGWETYFDDKKYENYYVFTSDLIPSLKKLDRETLTRKFGRAIEKIAKKRTVQKDRDKYQSNRFSLYSIKHTGNILAWKSGFSMTQLQLQNRHSSMQQTENYLRELKQEINEQPRPLRPSF